MQPILFSWSGGKDSAMALYAVQQNPELKIAALLTTVTEGYERISMHGVRKELLQAQAESLGYPLEIVYIPQHSSNQEYETRMAQMLAKYKSTGIEYVAFGDIFLEDLKLYREQKLATMDMKALFPLWKKDTSVLIEEYISSGFRGITTCVDTQVLEKRHVGRQIDREFINDLPSNADVCGENGEFHSFTYAGPVFKKNIGFTKGEIVLRDERFYYCDLIPE